MTTVEVTTEKSIVEVEQTTNSVEVVNEQPTVEVENGPTVEVTQGAVEVIELEPSLASVEVTQGAVELIEIGTEGPPGPQGPAGTSEVTRTAGETLSGHRVTTHDDDGFAIYAENTDSTHVRRAKWLTTGAVMQGASATMVAEGPVTEGSWAWTPGQPVYLGTNGTLTQTLPTVPAYIQEVAVALTPTTIYFDPQLPLVTV